MRGLRNVLAGTAALISLHANGEVEPFVIANQNPLTAIFGLPTPDAPPAFDVTHAVAFDVSSHYVSEVNAREQLLLDGETYRLTYSLRWRRENLWLGVDLPYVDHAGGVMDSSIQDWHRLFGLPDGGRDLAPNNVLRFFYRRNGTTRLDMTQAAGGIGDVQWRAGGVWRPNRWWEAALKVPTGDSADLHGSGSTDLAVALAARQSWTRLGAYARVGAVAMSRGDVLVEQQKPAVGFASVAATYVWSSVLTFNAQFDGHTGFYRDSAFAAVSGPALQFAFGPQLRFPNGARLDFAVVEDPIVSSGPDVTFHLRFALGI